MEPLSVLVVDSYNEMYDNKVFLRLTEQLLKEKKHHAVKHLYGKLVDKQLVQNDQDFTNKFFLLTNVGKANYKIDGQIF